MYRRLRVVSSFTRQQRKPSKAYHGYHPIEGEGHRASTMGPLASYHEPGREEFGLQMDSREAFFWRPMPLGSAHNNAMKRGRLEMVARDGIEPPTPAFSGLRSTD